MSGCDAPHQSMWSYTRAEILADGVVHAAGIFFGLFAAASLIVLAADQTEPWLLTALVTYSGSLLTVLVVSAAYNLWPLSPTKWLLRRFDHSAIYLLIAGTYSPFVAQRGAVSLGLLVAVWMASLAGISLKLLFPGRFDRVSIALYLLTGWSGLMAYENLIALPSSALKLLVAGGVLYTTGVAFHLWRSLPFHNAIWHTFVLAAAVCHYGAVMECVAASRA